MLERFHRLDLNLLRVLVAIDRARSVTEAGRRLGLSQPAASNALARLREAFGDPLYARVSGRLVPTPMAERVAAAAARHLESLEADLTGTGAFDPQVSAVQWRLSLSDLGEMVFLPPIAGLVRREAPQSRLANLAVPAERLTGALEAREIDLAIGILDPLQRGIRSMRLFRERYVALAGPECPAAWRTRSGFGDALLVVAAPTATYHQAVGEALQRHRLEQRIVVRARHFAAIPDLVAGGQLVAIVPAMFARMACERLPLVAWPLPFPMPAYEVLMAWHLLTDGDDAQEWLRRRVSRLFRGDRAALTVCPPAGSRR
jgi:DNA-binding transcriptional LysR family regulator